MTVFKGYIDQFGQNHQLVSSLINQNTENENSESISLEETSIDENAGVGVCSDNSNDDDDDDIPGNNDDDDDDVKICLLYTSPSPRDQRGSRMPSSA